MKIKFNQIIFAIIAAALILVSCSESDNPTLVPELEAPVLTVPDGSLLDGITGAGIIPVTGRGYVGAFWRADQTGERVIKLHVGSDVSNLGVWKAEVAWYDAKWNPAGGDGVVLSTNISSDSNIYTNNPDDAENHKVIGTNSIVSGTVASVGDILFRIGLTKPFEDFNEITNPARYAVVVLSYGTPAKKQKLFLRQGHGADYVMRPGDKDGISMAVGGAEERSFARKFSPYNLTDPNSNTETDYSAMTSVTTGLLSVNGGVFVDYPTKAGYLFQFNTSTRAFHPTTPTGAFANWNIYNGSEYWDGGIDETCPTGWRRPQDGNTISSHNSTGAVAGSEMRQSLWLNPQSGTESSYNNSVWGYYADGYFDRREISASACFYTNTAVNSSNKEVAYIGNIFFNPTTNASLFFPAAGRRNFYNGSFDYAGYGGYYLSGSSFSTGAAWILRFFGTSANASQHGYVCQYGFAVRCVRQE